MVVICRVTTTPEENGTRAMQILAVSRLFWAAGFHVLYANPFMLSIAASPCAFYRKRCSHHSDCIQILTPWEGALGTELNGCPLIIARSNWVAKNHSLGPKLAFSNPCFLISHFLALLEACSDTSTMRRRTMKTSASDDHPRSPLRAFSTASLLVSRSHACPEEDSILQPRRFASGSAIRSVRARSGCLEFLAHILVGSRAVWRVI